MIYTPFAKLIRATNCEYIALWKILEIRQQHTRHIHQNGSVARYVSILHGQSME